MSENNCNCLLTITITGGGLLISYSHENKTEESIALFIKDYLIEIFPKAEVEWSTPSGLACMNIEIFQKENLVSYFRLSILKNLKNEIQQEFPDYKFYFDTEQVSAGFQIIISFE